MLTEQITAGGVTQRLYYLDGGAIYVKQDNQADKVYYACTDHLGSVVKLVDGNGTEVFAATYDAWGKQTITDSTFAYYRGYTGHEHLPEFDLINMSGRLYDPTLGRFLSCDPFVQMPDFSQNFNRYSYCLNNPLKYNDPSGEFFWIPLIAAITVNGMQQGAEAQMNGKSFLSGAWKGAAVGAATSLVPYGVGQVFGHSVGSLGNELLRAGAHGLGNGLLNMAEGGKFGSGFLTGVAASFAGSAAQHFKFSSMGIIGSTTFAGALGAELSGGDWMAGAMQGMNIGLYNHKGDIAFGNDGKALVDADGNIIRMSCEDAVIIGQKPPFGFSGLGLAIVGAGATASEIKMYNRETWFSVKKWRTYSQKFNGNGYTWGKKAVAEPISAGFKWAGRGLGAYNAYLSATDYSNGKINGFQLITDEASNYYSTVGGPVGAAWGIGWESGRLISQTSWYKAWKYNNWYPWRYKNLGY